MKTCLVKETIKKMKKQATDRKKIICNADVTKGLFENI